MRDFCGFYRDIHEEKPEIIELKFTRVVFVVTPSSYLLNATIAEHLKRNAHTYRHVTDQIKNSIYVDDIVTGVENAEAFEFYKKSKHIFKSGGFNLRKFFKSRSPELN